MLRVIDYVISGIMMSSLVFYMISKLSGNSIDLKSWKTYASFILLGIAQQLNYHFISGYVKVLTITIFVIVLYYCFFKKDKKEAIVIAIFIEAIIILAEFIFSILIMLIYTFNFSDLVANYFGSGIFVINLIIAFFSYILVQIKSTCNLYNIIMKWCTKANEKFIIILIMIIMVTINIVYSSLYYKLDIKYLLIINITLLTIYVYIILKILNEKDKYIRINSKYNMTISSLHELGDVVSILKIKSHENRNQLKTIRDMIKKKDKKVIEYINALLGDKLKEDEKLRVETSLITNSEISSLIYSKMITMKDKGINTNLHVDKAIQKSNLYDLDEIMTLYICKIIGVWIDNAIEAVSNLETKNIEMQMYVDLDNNLNIIISNNYDGYIDLKSINQEGYTTKGGNHGYGLSLVKDIIGKNNKIIVDTKLKNNIFMQSLKVKM